MNKGIITVQYGGKEFKKTFYIVAGKDPFQNEQSTWWQCVYDLMSEVLLSPATKWIRP